jgi:diguanylate cyclase (GGDEF)-like protein/PAS domain S-box-containing protein
VVPRRLGIRSQLLGLVAAAAVPFLVLIGIALWNQYRAAETESLERAYNEARVIAAQIDDHLGNLENLALGLSRAVGLGPAHTAANDALLTGLKAQLPGFISDIAVVGPDGENIGSASGARYNIGDRDYFQQALAGKPLAIGDPVHNRRDGDWVLPIARPVTNAAGEIRAVLLTGTLIAKFQDAIRVDHLPMGSSVRIVNDKGIVVAAFPEVPELVGRDPSNLDAVVRHLHAKETREVATWSDGVPRFTGHTTAHRAPWLVSVGLPTAVASTRIATQLERSGLFGIAAIAIASVIAWMVSGHIIRPLRQLERDAAMLASGELGHRTSIASAGEFGSLAEAFNLMASSLERRRNANLEHTNELRRIKNTLDAVIDASPVAIVCSDLDRRVFVWNRAAEDMYGYTEAEVLGAHVKMVPPELADQSLELYRRARAGETVPAIETTRCRKDGTVVEVRLAAAPVFAEDGRVRGVAFAHEDITARKRAEEQLRQFAHFDQLTGLPNRHAMRVRLEDLLDDGNRQVSVALLDLDGFKEVNDTLGHSTGDRLLMQVAGRLRSAVAIRAPEALACRLGGDEFVVIVPDCGSPQKMSDIISEVLAGLSQPFAVGDHIAHLGASAGIAIAPMHGSDFDELLSNADLALYLAKSIGGRVYRYFTPSLRMRAQSRRALIKELHQAFASKEFELYYQPQIRLADGAVMGVEALLRWHHPERGLLEPNEFHEVLSGTSLAVDVGRWVLATACAQAAQWRRDGFLLSRIAVNLFPKQICDPSMIADVEATLRDTGLAPELLELEITEDIALNYEEAAKPLARLRGQGVKLAFDDFGTGFASLRYLTLFPVSRIKIDRTFVKGVINDPKSATIVRSLLGMARSLALEVIAEGVETNAHAAFLRNEHCDEAQGYLYSRPLSAADFARYLKVAQLAGVTGFGDIAEGAGHGCVRQAQLVRIGHRPRNKKYSPGAARSLEHE